MSQPHGTEFDLTYRNDHLFALRVLEEALSGFAPKRGSLIHKLDKSLSASKRLSSTRIANDGPFVGRFSPLVNGPREVQSHLS